MKILVQILFFSLLIGQEGKKYLDWVLIFGISLVNMSICGVGCNNILLAGKGSGRETSIFGRASHSTGRNISQTRAMINLLTVILQPLGGGKQRAEALIKISAIFPSSISPVTGH